MTNACIQYLQQRLLVDDSEHSLKFPTSGGGFRGAGWQNAPQSKTLGGKMVILPPRFIRPRLPSTELQPKVSQTMGPPQINMCFSMGTMSSMVISFQTPACSLGFGERCPQIGPELARSEPARLSLGQPSRLRQVSRAGPMRTGRANQDQARPEPCQVRQDQTRATTSQDQG